MNWEYLLTDRTINFAIVYCNITNYDLELVERFFKKLETLLFQLNNKNFRKDLKINISFPFSVYFTSIDSKYLEKLTNINYNNFKIIFLEATSLKDAILKISPIFDESILNENQDTDEIVLKEDKDTFLYFESISPLLDIDHSLNLILDHFTYLAEYTYSDIAISGFLPIVCNMELAKRISLDNQVDPWNWSEFLLRNTQSVDLEIYYIEPDYRKYRIRLDLYSERFQKICKNLIQYKKDLIYQDLEDIFQNHVELIRITPSYIEIELTTENELSPIVYPKNSNKKHLSLELFQKVLSDLKEYQMKEAFTLSLGGTGEPFLYNNLLEVINLAYESKLFKKIYIETFFYTVNKEVLEQIKTLKHLFTFIIKLPTLNEILYEKLMGKNLLPKIKENLKLLNDSYDVYIEILRIQQVEEELEEFFNHFKNTTFKPIVGRYFTYGGILNDYSVVDLEPLEKDYCRSLMFHIYIQADGKVPMCRQDIIANHKNWDLNHISLKDIFDEMKKYYNNFIKKEYDNIIPICKTCKDWFVFLG